MTRRLTPLGGRRTVISPQSSVLATRATEGSR